MRAVLLGILVVALAGTGFYFWTRSREGRNSQGFSAASSLGVRTTATVEEGDVNFVVSVAGEIGPAEQVSVRPEVNGRIRELPVDVGDRVPKDGLLFSLDDRDLRIEVETREKEIESAKLQLDKARIAMEQAKRDFDRDKELFEAKLVSAQVYENTRQRYDSASKDHDLARNNIERSEKEVDLARERLLKTRIQAPFDCTVLTRPVSEGQAVSGSGGFNSGTEVLTIADLSSMVISAHVNQADVTHLKQGLPVEVEVDALPGLRIRGEVARIAPQATIKNNLKGYATRIVLKEVDPRVQPGMTATISIPVSSVSNVLTVPLSAVFSESETGEHYVLVRNGDSFEHRPVTVGVSDFFKVEIRTGLSAGETVALVDPGGLANRMAGTGNSSRPPGPRTAVAAAPTTSSSSSPGTKAGSGSAVTTTTPAAGQTQPASGARPTTAARTGT